MRFLKKVLLSVIVVILVYGYTYYKRIDVINTIGLENDDTKKINNVLKSYFDKHNNKNYSSETKSQPDFFLREKRYELITIYNSNRSECNEIEKKFSNLNIDRKEYILKCIKNNK